MSSPQAAVRVCALIVTRHRAEQLKLCLRRLLDEVPAPSPGLCAIDLRVRVLVDEEGAVDRIQELREQFPSVEFHSVPEKLGPARGRNALFEQSLAWEYDWVLFVDDDAVPGPGYLSRFLEILGSDPRADVIGGPNLTPPDSNPFQIATGAALACRFGNFLSTARYRASGGLRESGEQELILCNLFVKRSWMQKVRFPAHYVCAEENRLLQELKLRGARLVHDPALSVLHDRRPSPGALAAQVFKYGTGRGQNLKDSPTSLRWPYVFPSLVLMTLLLLALSALFGDPASKAVLLFLALTYGLTCAVVSAGLAIGSRAATGLQRLRFGLDCAIVFPILHFSYALGVLRGLIR